MMGPPVMEKQCGTKSIGFKVILTFLSMKKEHFRHNSWPYHYNNRIETYHSPQCTPGIHILRLLCVYGVYSVCIVCVLCVCVYAVSPWVISCLMPISITVFTDRRHFSDLCRASKTAEAISGLVGLEVQLDERLRESNLGCLQGIKRHEVKDDPKLNDILHKFWSSDSYCIPDGERQEH